MGEAKRRRDAAKTVRTIKTHNPMTGETTLSRLTCGPFEFIQEMQDFDARNVPGQRASTRTPCNGCRECCWYSKVEVYPEVEDPADLAHLDMVPAGDEASFVLRKKADGSCIHLGDNGCEVYHHRPRACRNYDCRATSVVGLIQSYDNGHRSPVWYFPPRTDQEAAVMAALCLAAMQEASRHPERDVRGIAQETLQTLPLVVQQMNALTSNPEAQRLVAMMQSMPEAERQRFAEAYGEMVRHAVSGGAK